MRSFLYLTSFRLCIPPLRGSCSVFAGLGIVSWTLSLDPDTFLCQVAARQERRRMLWQTLMVEDASGDDGGLKMMTGRAKWQEGTLRFSATLYRVEEVVKAGASKILGSIKFDLALESGKSLEAKSTVHDLVFEGGSAYGGRLRFVLRSCLEGEESLQDLPPATDTVDERTQ
eukprot:752459-Hanusia_phi.AAC.6